MTHRQTTIEKSEADAASSGGHRWMSLILKLAAVYNLIWGCWVILWPLSYFQITGLELPTHPAIWQGMGMVIGVYGLGYWWASYDPIRHWPIVAVGFLGKIFGPIGFLFNLVQGTIPVAFGMTMLTNDFAWWIPFGWILLNVHRAGWPLRDASE